MATQQGLPSSQVKLAIGSNRCKQNWIWKKNLWNMALTFDKGLIDQMMLYIHSRSYQSYWGAGEELYNIGAILTKLWHILNSMMFFIHSLTRSVLLDILRCHHMLMYSFRFRPIKQQWSFNVMSRLYFSRSWQKGSEYPLICFCMPENSVRVGRTLS